MTITLPKPPFAVSDSTAQKIAVFDERTAALAYAQERHSAEVIELNDVKEWSRDNGIRAERLRAEKLSLLHEELSVRQLFDELADTIFRIDQPAAKRASFADLEEAKQAVIDALVRIGFQDAPSEWHHGRNPLRDSMIVYCHPTVVDAHARHETVSNFGLRDARIANQGKIEKLEERIAKAKTEATAGLM